MSRNHKRTMHVFFTTYGYGPWTCEECGKQITQLGQGRMDGNVHHRDDDKTNDVPKNLAVLHTVCHLRLHAPDAAMRKRISDKLRGRPSPTKGMRFSAEVNAKKSHPGESNPFFGRKHGDADLVKMRQPRRRQTCEQCGGVYAVNWITRHVKEGKCRPS